MMADVPPVLTDTQKLQVREVQLTLVTIQAEKAMLESRLKDLDRALPVATEAVNRKLKEVAPKGYVVKPDLTVIPEQPAK